MSDLPLFKTVKGCEVDQLKARVLELQDAITTALACMTTEDDGIFNEILRVAQRNQYHSLLLHDAEVLERFMQKDWMDSGHDLKTIYRLRDEIHKLRQQAEEKCDGNQRSTGHYTTRRVEGTTHSSGKSP